MADIRLINIIPTQTIPGVQQPVGSTGSGPQPVAIPNLPAGTILNGFIVNRDAGGNPVLRTASADIAFSTNFFLNIGSEVTIRVENSPTGTLAHILSVDGQPPEVAVMQSAFGQEPEVIVSRNLTPGQQPVTQTQGTTPPLQTQPVFTVTGTVITPPHDAPPQAQPLPPGTQVTLKIVTLAAAPSLIPEDIAALAAPQTPAASPALPGSAPASYAAYARGAVTPFAAPLPAITATTVSTVPAPAVVTTNAVTPELPQVAVTPATPATVNALLAQPQAPSTPQTTQATPVQNAPVIPTSPGQTFTTTVIGNEPTGAALVQTPMGMVRLQAGTVLPPGSQVTFEVVSTTPPPTLQTAAQTVGTTPAPLTELAQHWTSLQQIVGLLAERDTSSGLDFVQPNMPWLPGTGAALSTPSAQAQNIPTGLMLFMAALRGGDFRNWLGEDSTRWLEDQGHGDLVRKAGAEFITMGRQLTEAPQQQWQSVFFPIAYGGELQQVRLFVKRDKKDGSAKATKKNEDTRFVVEVDLTQLGEIQMDGFVRRQEKSVQFDMVIRSLTALSADVQQDIMQIYNDTGALTGFKGSLAFQAVREFPVNPMEEIAGHTGTVVV